MSLSKAFNIRKNLTSTEAHWIPLSDLMTGLMMVFMLIAVIFMGKIENDSKSIKQIALVYNDMKISLYKELISEFKNDLPVWGAELDPDLTFRFKEPDVLFDTGKDSLKPRFTMILNQFFPRYIRIISSEKYKASIEEIRIEGHTSSVWNSSVPPQESYFLNMELSQARTRTTLKYVLSLPSVQNQQSWLKSNLTANGLSSSRPILNKDSTENIHGSQRVEFRLRTNAESRLINILDKI